ncbi:MAG: hypothetical protein J0I41_03940 [Filimonas sp.]|nr:hypothetical protein [Filimonas sp.]
MENEETPKLSFAERMKQKAMQQKNYGHELEKPEQAAGVAARDCPNCGAPRAQQDGLTKCAYCGFEFIQTTLSDGMYIRKEDNSRQ